MTIYLLDTNHLADAIGKISAFRERIHQMRRQGIRFTTCWPAIFELEMGAAQTKDPIRCRRNLKVLLKEVRIRPLDWDLLDTFGQVHMLLKKRGRVLSIVDKVLCAIAVRDDAILLTTDGDFEGVREIRTENWLT